MSYRVTTTKGEVLEVHSPSKLPPQQQIETIEEPLITGIIITPPEYLGNILKLCDERRGIQKRLSYLSKTRVLL